MPLRWAPHQLWLARHALWNVAHGFLIAPLCPQKKLEGVCPQKAGTMAAAMDPLHHNHAPPVELHSRMLQFPVAQIYLLYSVNI